MSKNKSSIVKTRVPQFPLVAKKPISGPGVPSRTGYGVAGIKPRAVTPAAIAMLTSGRNINGSKKTGLRITGSPTKEL